MNCSKCGKFIPDENYFTDRKGNNAICSVCLSGTERSEALQGCLPSTTGSASAAPTEPESVQSQNASVAKPISNDKRKMDTALINSVVQLPVSDLLAAESILSLVTNQLAAEYEKNGSTWQRDWMQKHVNDRAALIRARNVLIERAEARSTPTAGGVSGGS